MACVLLACKEEEFLIEPRYYPRDSHHSYSQSMIQVGLGHTQLYRNWVDAHDRAMSKPVIVKTPFQETFYFDDNHTDAYGYQFAIERGQKTTISINQLKGDSGHIYMDLYYIVADTIQHYEHIASSDTVNNRIVVEHEIKGEFLLRVQPELLHSGVYNLTIVVEPSLGFPVSGGEEHDIGSLFGVPRDAGKRVHEGIDIFAKRHTPIVSVSDGKITFAGAKEGSLGGTVIWARDTLRDITMYYAHLQEVYVEIGDYVLRGDTIGSNGNSGNAATTYPHLHFGIYDQGAVDPFPYVVETRTSPSSILADSSWLNKAIRINNPGGTNRNLYSRRLDQFMSHNEYANVTGVTATYYKVKKVTGEMSYVFYDHIEPLNRPIHGVTLENDINLYNRPDIYNAWSEIVPKGSTIKILAQAGVMSFCELHNGIQGWAEI